MDLPQVSLKDYEKLLRLLVEDGEAAFGDDYQFLKDIGFISDSTLASEITEVGQEYYDAKFIRSDDILANKILHDALLVFPPCSAIIQLLHGVADATRDNALSVLKSRGFWCYVDETPLTHLLLMMNQVGLITYSKQKRTLKILYNPHSTAGQTPASIFIEPSTPYSNVEWLRRILGNCEQEIFWLDKHFLKSGLSYIWEAADANKVRAITVLSLQLKEHDKKTINEYRKLKRELALKRVSLTWLVIDPKKIRDSHDRWILTPKLGWNLPDINTIVSGNRSEINESPNHKKLIPIFKKYCSEAKEIGT